jgi:hypothetical protein
MAEKREENVGAAAKETTAVRVYGLKYNKFGVGTQCIQRIHNACMSFVPVTRHMNSSL